MEVALFSWAKEHSKVIMGTKIAQEKLLKYSQVQLP